MLMAVPKFGRVKAPRLLNQCRISQSKTVGGLSDRQRQELIGLFNRVAAPRLRRHRPLGRRQGDDGAGAARRASRGCGSPSRRRRGRAGPGEGDGVHYWFLSDEEFDRRLAAGDFLEHHVFPWGQRSGTLLSELDRIARRRATCRCSSSSSKARSRSRTRMPGAVTIFVDAPLDELERRLRERATESARRDRGADRARRRAEGARATASTTWSRTTTASAPPTSASRIVERELAACRYHGPSMIHPRIDQLLDQVDSRYALVIVAAKRARQINNYHHQLGEGTFDEFAPPLVQSRSKNYLTMSLEEIAEGKIKYEYNR